MAPLAKLNPQPKSNGQTFRQARRDNFFLGRLNIIVHPANFKLAGGRIINSVRSPVIAIPGLTDTPHINEIFLSQRDRDLI